MVQFEDLARRLVHHATGGIELKVRSQAEGSKSTLIASDEPFPYSSDARQMTWPNDLEEQLGPNDDAEAGPAVEQGVDSAHELPAEFGAELPQSSESRTSVLWPAYFVQAALSKLPSLTCARSARLAGVPPRRLSHQVRSVSFGPVEVHEVECWKQLTRLQHASRKELRQAARAEEQDRLWEFEMDEEEDEESTAQHGEWFMFSTREDRASKNAMTSLMGKWRRWILMVLGLILFEVVIKVWDGFGDVHFRPGLESPMEADAKFDLRPRPSSDFQIGGEGRRRYLQSVITASEGVGEASGANGVNDIEGAAPPAVPDAPPHPYIESESPPQNLRRAEHVVSGGTSSTPAESGSLGGVAQFVVTQDGGVRRRNIP